MKSTPPLRLFIALYPPQGWIDAALACLPLGQLPSGRATKAEQLHLTLAFLGDRLERDLPKIVESIQGAVAGMRAFDVSTTGLTMLPEEGPPRLIAASLTGTAQLLELQRRLARRLVSKRRETEFVPHVSLYRFGATQAAGKRRGHEADEATDREFDVQGEVDSAGDDARVEALHDESVTHLRGEGVLSLRERVAQVLPAVYLQTFRVSEIALVSSVLHPLGVKHRIIERVPLGGLQGQS